MGDHQHGHALFGQLPHDREHLTGQFRVQSAGGLVKIDDLRVGGKCPGNGHALLLAAGKLTRVGVCPVGKAHLCQHFHTHGVRLLSGHPAGHDQPLGHVLQSSLVPEEVVVLEHKGRLFAQAGDVGPVCMGQIKALAVKDQLACVGSLKKVQTPQQGGLAGAGGAENGHHIALFHGQVHPAQHLQLMGSLSRTGTVEDARMQAGLCIGAECFLHIADL